MAISTSPGSIIVSGGGLVDELPPASAIARHQRPGGVAQVRVAEGAPGPTGAGRSTVDLLEPELEAAVVHHDVEELGHVGLDTNAAMRAPPMCCGLTTRSAPAARSFASLSTRCGPGRR